METSAEKSSLESDISGIVENVDPEQVFQIAGVSQYSERITALT